MLSSATVTSGTRQDRQPELDGIRGVAVMMVILYHAFFWSMNDGGSLVAWSLPARLCANLTRPGWLGVDLFFVLSGFLITGILVQTRESPRYLGSFYGRRVLRILPLYYLLLLAILFFYRGHPGSASFVGLSLVYLSNLTPLFGVPTIYGSLWSLAVEEHFYLVWPFLCRAISGRALTLLSLAIVVSEPLLRLIGTYRGSDTYSYTWFRLDGLAMGALLALYVRSPSCTRRRLLLLGGAAAMGGLLLLLGGAPFGILTRRRLVGATMQYSAAQLFFTGVIATALGGAGTRLLSPLRARVLGRCGDLSYCLYLIHILIFDGYDRLIASRGLHPAATLGPFGAVLARAAGALLVSFLLAEASFRYLETPILRLKRHFPY